MRQHFFNKEKMTGGMILEDELFREIVRTSFCENPYHRPQKLVLSMGTDEEECRPVVKIGQHIAQYDLIGVRDSECSEDYHVIRADHAGIVTNIWKKLVGFKKYETIVELNIDEKKTDGGWHQYLRGMDEKRQMLICSGIPGINHLLYDGNTPRRCRYLILNILEDDPSRNYNTYMIMTFSGKILYGLIELMRLIEADEVWIVVSERQTEAVQSLHAAADRYFQSAMMNRFTMITVPDNYPVNDEILQDLYIREYLGGAVWVIAHVNHVIGSYDLIYEGKPWTRKKIMVGGCLPVNGVYDCSIGTRLTDIPEMAEYMTGCWIKSAGILVNGGIMSGCTIDPETAVVLSESNELLFLPRIEEQERLCRNCGLCSKICPRLLDPRVSDSRENREKCVQCGLCSYVCPSRRRLAEYMRRGRPQMTVKEAHYIELLKESGGMLPAVITGYTAPYIRKAHVPFACILSSFKVQ